MNIDRYNNFISIDSVNKLYQSLFDYPRWRFQKFAGGSQFWWYCIFPNYQNFHGSKENPWSSVEEPLWKETFDKICNLRQNFIPWRFIINGQTQHQDGSPHSDFASDNEGNCLTYILYLNPNWDTSWGGSTEFYTGSEITHLEIPEPGKLICYDGKIRHRGLAPLIPNILRVTLSIQGVITNNL